MKKALIVTVGGSDEPIVQAIKSYEPDFVYFICSKGDVRTGSTHQVDGEGKICCRRREIKCLNCSNIIEKGEYYPSIVVQAGYPKEKYKKIELDNPDDFEEVYKKISSTIAEAKQQNFDEIIADFTGGTKTMSAVLEMLACFDWDIKLSLVKGQRRDVVKTTVGSVPVILDVSLARANYVLNIVDALISRYLYYSACLLLEDLLKNDLPSSIQSAIIRKYSICKAFSCWDSFEYREAFKLLKAYAGEYEKQFQYLLKLLGKTKHSAYEPVFDLISNAERQAKNGFYNNATARLYRALELFAQIRLKTTYGIDTSHIERVSEEVKKKISFEKYERYKNEDGEIKIGLIQAYELLAELSDEIGSLYKNQKNEFIRNIKIRNESKLGHGDMPVNENDWCKMLSFCKKFIEECCGKLKIKVEYAELPCKLS